MREAHVISPAPPPVRRRRRPSGRFLKPTQVEPPASYLPIASLPIEPGGMVDLALRELGARLVAVLPDSDQCPGVSRQ